MEISNRLKNVKGCGLRSLSISTIRLKWGACNIYEVKVRIKSSILRGTFILSRNNLFVCAHLHGKADFERWFRKGRKFTKIPQL